MLLTIDDRNRDKAKLILEQSGIEFEETTVTEAKVDKMLLDFIEEFFEISVSDFISSSKELEDATYRDYESSDFSDELISKIKAIATNRLIGLDEIHDEALEAVAEALLDDVKEDLTKEILDIVKECKENTSCKDCGADLREVGVCVTSTGTFCVDDNGLFVLDYSDMATDVECANCNSSNIGNINIEEKV